LFDASYVLDPGQRDSLFGVLRRQEIPFGGGPPLVAVRQIQRAAPGGAVDEQVRLRHDDAGHIKELVGLPENRGRMDARRSLDQRHAPGADGVGDARAAASELVAREVGGKLRASRLGLTDHFGNTEGQGDPDARNCAATSDSGSGGLHTRLCRPPGERSRSRGLDAGACKFPVRESARAEGRGTRQSRRCGQELD